MPTAAGVTLFVWSKKQATSANIGTSGRHRLEGGYGAGAGEPEYETRPVLPEDQQAVVDLVQRLSQVRKVPVELVDLGRTRHFIERRRALERGWTDFPVLVASDGRTLVGSAAFSDETVTKVLTGGTYVAR
jgi:hypothetical protein